MKLDEKILNDRWYATLPPLTPWFPPTKRPVRPGVYMVDQSHPDQIEQCVFSLWNGKNWHPQGSTPEDALKWACYGPIKTGRYRPHAFRKWRGLKGEEE